MTGTHHAPLVALSLLVAELFATRGLAIGVIGGCLAVVAIALIGGGDRRARRTRIGPAGSAKELPRGGIGERPGVRERSRESGARYQRLVAASPYGIFVCDADGTVMEVDPAAEEIFSAGDVVGRPSTEFIEENERAVFRRALAASSASAARRVPVRAPSGWPRCPARLTNDLLVSRQRDT